MALTLKHILMTARDAGGDREMLYSIWKYLRDEADAAHHAAAVVTANGYLKEMGR